MGATISTTQFYFYGRRHFTQTGYVKHKAKYNSSVQDSPSIKAGQEGADGIDLSNKVVCITGANSGIGKTLATYAAAKGAKLYMFCRSKDRAEAARKEIEDETSSTNIEIVLMDLAEMESIKEAIKGFQKKEKKVDILVCNGGVLLNDKKMSSEGNEMTFASHLLGGTYLLSQLLLPQLKAADEGKIVIVSSGGMYNSPFPDWATATSSEGASHDYNGNLAYSYAKRGQVLLAEQYTKMYPEITTVTCHPGWTATPAVDDAYGDNKKYLEPMRTMWEGAEGIAWLMGAKKDEIESGAFYLDRKPQRKHLSGPFFTEGSYTKNSQAEVDEMMANLKKAAGL
ncbi:dehydrogenase/reductase [Nitzschia inconspicua]|uniref:Dehydrogenase/reductase n=1 Tax=Nitzschia inconspicua TaxID=303405 RepID=A0A9K3PVB1_9STRA|nr:dehydrogenase/reductase [Nitzschia inconspicua]